MTAYDRDLHAWAREQAAVLRARSANEVDWENVAEEIESLGKQQVAELTRRFELLMLHLLKWCYQPERQGRSWRASIADQRRRIARLVRQNPSLQSAFVQAFEDAYEDARFSASREMLGEPEPEMFPAAPPFTAEQALDPEWLPDAVDATTWRSPG